MSSTSLTEPLDTASKAAGKRHSRVPGISPGIKAPRSITDGHQRRHINVGTALWCAFLLYLLSFFIYFYKLSFHPCFVEDIRKCCRQVNTPNLTDQRTLLMGRSTEHPGCGVLFVISKMSTSRLTLSPRGRSYWRAVWESFARTSQVLFAEHETVDQMLHFVHADTFGVVSH